MNPQSTSVRLLFLFEKHKNSSFLDEPNFQKHFFFAFSLELFNLDGRLISNFEKEKSAQKQDFEITDLPKGRSFFVRVSDGKTSATGLVVKL